MFGLFSLLSSDINTRGDRIDDDSDSDGIGDMYAAYDMGEMDDFGLI